MTVKYRLADIRKLRGEMPKQIRNIEKAKRWALDRVTQRAATFISRDIRKVYAIRAADIKGHLSIKKYEDTGRALLYTGRALPLETFHPKTKRIAITATSARGRPFRTHRRATTVRMRKDVGRRVVGRHKKSTGSRPTGPGFLAKGHVLARRNYDDNSTEYGLVQRYGPSIPGMVAYPETIQGAERLVQDELPREFSERLDYLLNKD